MSSQALTPFSPGKPAWPHAWRFCRFLSRRSGCRSSRRQQGVASHPLLCTRICFLGSSAQRVFFVQRARSIFSRHCHCAAEKNAAAVQPAAKAKPSSPVHDRRCSAERHTNICLRACARSLPPPRRLLGRAAAAAARLRSGTRRARRAATPCASRVRSPPARATTARSCLLTWCAASRLRLPALRCRGLLTRVRRRFARSARRWACASS